MAAAERAVARAVAVRAVVKAGADLVVARAAVVRAGARAAAVRAVVKAGTVILRCLRRTVIRPGGA